MAKTVLRSVLIILILAGVVFFGLQLMEKQKKQTPPQVETESVPTRVAITQIRTTEMAKGALVQISEVPGAGYRVSPLPLPSKGVVVEIPEVDVRLAQNTVMNPHPLIQSIEASSSSAGGRAVARIQINLAGEPSYRDRLIGTTLYVELAGDVPAAQPVVEATVEPTAAPKVMAKPKATKKKAAVAKKSSKKAKTRKTIVKKATPTPMPEPVVEDEPFVDDEPAMADTPVAAAEPSQPDVPTGNEPAMEDDINLDELFGEGGDSGFGGDVPQEAPQVAAIPPASSGTFDSAALPDNLPSINTINVGDEGGITTVRINRDASTPYKVFRMINPNRVVVDFKDARNRLQVQYGEFPGTRVRKITTQQFAGPDGAITRVMVYVDGMPQYQKAIEGNDFVLKLP